MSTKKNMFHKHTDCRKCTETVQGGFKYVTTREGEKYIFKMLDTFTLVFLLKGKALISCNEFVNVSVNEGEMILWPMNSNCSWVSVMDTACIVLEGISDIPVCDRKVLKEYADKWLNVVPAFKTLSIRSGLDLFLLSVKIYVEDGINCPHIHKAKQLELSTLFRAYYLPEELMDFLIPTICDTHEFETFIMNNYLNMKGVKEFVDLSGMNIGTFNRKFKSHFHMSPYQWLIKQKSKHIYYELSVTDKSFTDIAKEFKFTDASHFNRYCKAMFGSSPTAIRKTFKISHRQ